MQTIVLGGGCFWCLEAPYVLIQGVDKVTSGYSGGAATNATYEQVITGMTNHAEVVRITFNPAIISLKDILDIFWVIHDPTTPNQQGNDIGTQYRSVIFYSTEAQKIVINASIQEAQKLWKDPIVTQVVPLEAFYPAEDYHQNYFENHPDQAYCQVVINPKLTKLREKFSQRLK